MLVMSVWHRSALSCLPSPGAPPALVVITASWAWLLVTCLAAAMPKQYQFLPDVWKYITEGLDANDQSFCKFLTGKYPDTLALAALAAKMEQFLMSNTGPCTGEGEKHVLPVSPPACLAASVVFVN